MEAASALGRLGVLLAKPTRDAGLPVRCPADEQAGRLSPRNRRGALILLDDSAVNLRP